MTKKSKIIYVVGSIIIGVAAMLIVLLGLIVGGVLDEGRKRLVFSSESYEFVYDGDEHSYDKWQLTGGSLEENHTAVVTVTGSQREVGESLNYLSASIVDDNGEDVSDYYEIEYQPGTLRVVPRAITISSQDAEKTYDGTALASEKCEIVEGGLVDGHILHVWFDQEIIVNAGTHDNKFVARIFESDGITEVTGNYDITYLYGELKILPYRVSILTQSSVQIYDGTPLTCQQYEITSEEGLLEGHSITSVTMPASLTDVGTIQNAVTDIAICDEQGNEVTSNYEIEYFCGSLMVAPRPIAIRSGSASKDYDGEELVCPEWEIVSITMPVEGHEVSVAVSGTRTEVGESNNTIAEVLITDGDRNVTFNYDVSFELGLLVVKGESSGGSGSGGSGGGQLNTSGDIGLGLLPSDGGEDIVALRVLSDVKSKIYLRLMSYGDLKDNVWGAAREYDRLLDSAYSCNYLSGIALGFAGYERHNVFIESLSSQYLLPYYMALGKGGYDVQSSDVAYAGNTDGDYNLTFYVYDIKTDGAVLGLLGSYTDEELAYRQFVRENYLSCTISAALKERFDALIEANGWRSGKDIAQIVGEVASFVQNAATYDLNYDRGLDSSSDIVYDFLFNDRYNSGVCQHYATAATVLLRYLGIPARYTIGYVGFTEAGEWTDIKSSNAHAWTEVYIDGFGWVQLEVTGGGLGGMDSSDGTGGTGQGGSVSSGTLKVKPVDEYLLYDGVSVLRPSGKLQGLYDLEQLGYTYEVSVSGSQWTIGKSASRIDCFVLYDPYGNDVTDDFDISFSEGVLQVYVSTVTVKTESASKVYDGTALTEGGYTADSQLLYGHSIEITVTGSQTKVGRNINTFKVKITDSEGNDVTYMYRIIADYGTLEVEARSITVAAEDASKQYDGTPLIMNSYRLSPEGDALAEGHEIIVVIYGSQTNIGYCDNVVSSVVILDAAKNDVTANYIVNIENGRLTVTP